VIPDAIITPPIFGAATSYHIAEINTLSDEYDQDPASDPTILRSMLDSGATHSICNDARKFVKDSLRKTDVRVRSAMQGQDSIARQAGSISLCCDNGETILLRNVLLCPTARYNIISVPQLDAAGYTVSFHNQRCTIGRDSKQHIQRLRAEGEQLYFVNLVINNRPTLSTNRSLPSTLSCSAICDINAAMCSSNDCDETHQFRYLFGDVKHNHDKNHDRSGGGKKDRRSLALIPIPCYGVQDAETALDTPQPPTIHITTHTNAKNIHNNETDESHVGLAQTYRGDQSEYDLYHQRMIHVHDTALKRAYPKLKIPDKCACPACVAGKMHQFPFKAIGERIECKPGEIIDTDLAGPFVNSRKHYRYRAVYIDQSTDYTMSSTLPKKSDQEDAWKLTCAFVKKHTGSSPKVRHSDGGGEFLTKAQYNDAFREGMQIRASAPDVHNQNPFAERKNRTLDEAVSTIMHNASAPSTMWALANAHVVFTHNVIPYRKVPDPEDAANSIWLSRADLFFSSKRPFDLKNLRVWGCEMWAYVPVKNRTGPKNHLRLKTRHGVFVGYDSRMKGYVIYDLKTRKLFRAAFQHTVSNESVFPWRDNRNKTAEESFLPPSFLLPDREILTPELVRMYFEDMDDAPPPSAEDVIYDPGASLFDQIR
jgi:hypothetical protein